MASVRSEVKLSCSADRAWETIGDFSAAEWIPGVLRVELLDAGVGGRRKVHNDQGGTVVEQLLSRDPAARTLTYAILEAPMPIENYLATLRVDEAQDGCKVSWAADFEAPAEALSGIQQALQRLFDAAVGGLSERLG